jgi:hypothetical protein
MSFFYKNTDQSFFEFVLVKLRLLVFGNNMGSWVQEMDSEIRTRRQEGIPPQGRGGERL